MFYDLSGRFKYDQLTPAVNNDAYVQEFGTALQLGKFQFEQVTPSADGDFIQEVPFLGLSGKRIYQVTPALDEDQNSGVHRLKYSGYINPEIHRKLERDVIEITTIILASGILEEDIDILIYEI